MAVLKNSFEGIPSGNTLTTTNSDDGGGAIFQFAASSGAGSSLVVNTSAALVPAVAQGIVCTVGAANGYAKAGWDVALSTDGRLRCYIETLAANPSSTVRFMEGLATTTVRWQVRLNTSNQIELTDGAGAPIRRTPTLSYSTVYRVEPKIVSAHGDVELLVYEGNSTTPLTITTFTGSNIVSWNHVNFGYIGGSTVISSGFKVAAVAWSDEMTSPIGPESLPSVSRALGTTWNTQAVVAASRSTRWHANAVLTAARSTSWRVLTSVSPRTLASSWNVRGLPSRTLQTSWNTLVEGHVFPGEELFPGTDVYPDGLSVVSRALGTTWHVSRQASRELSTEWRTALRLSAERSFLWSVNETVIKPMDIRWHTAEQVSEELATSWHDRVLTSRATSTRWNVRSMVSPSELSTTWNARAFASQALVTSWHVAALPGIASVSAALGTSWHVVSRAVRSLDSSWNTQALVGRAVQTGWQAAERVSASRSTSWNTLGGTESPPTIARPRARLLPKVQIKRGDQRPGVRIRCMDGTRPVDLSIAGSVKILGRLDGELIVNRDHLAGTTDGLVSIEKWEPAETANPGILTVEVEVTWSDGTTTTFPGNSYLEVEIVPDLG